MLGDADVDLAELRKLSWTGVPRESRAKVWMLLQGYLPTRRSRREETLRVKRDDYLSSLPKYYSADSRQKPLEEDQRNLRQILVDIPRTAPDLPLFHSPEARQSMEHVLYMYAIRHPATGYVQGMNDIVTPFYACFLADRVCGGDLSQINAIDTSALPRALLDEVEADTYWCLTKLLDGIQDHYTTSQPGLQKMVFQLQAVVNRIDAPLHAHFEAHGLGYMNFAFRWMNCLLLREVTLPLIARLWDTYLSEERDGFSSFHVYVCAALLVSFSEELRKLPLEDMIIFLQSLPTQGWGEDRAESLLSQAYILQTLFDGSPAHLRRG